ncbi:4Fe-4S cluster-binding domain-containing protein [Campylobacter insulaenigrae]|uniref:4Fe-4S cluster-binding domain-containing protein n=1 Tax=Campylobacter insulaenigrae TaxID=260714 RepID=UPI00215364A1|nr:4Fe-4S cluster-binding domain-containing protein [Campylobacter insulaenigrae]MCR6577693.1 4Fe-4S cluster-binding domain-containing protein [Campylobacter insulaenigrae]
MKISVIKRWILSLVKNRRQHEKMEEKINYLENKILNLESEKISLINNMGGGILNKVKKVTPRPFLHGISVHLAEHCNLNCFSCDNFSQLAKEGYYKIEDFDSDMQKLSDITNGIVEQFYLVGGEPLLNKNCKDYFYVVRKYFKKSSIWLITNGILLPKQDNAFWRACCDNEVTIRPTKYPIKVDWEYIKQKCKDYNIELSFFNDENVEKTSFKTALNLKGDSDPFDNFVICHRANCRIQINNGIIYPCPVVANVKYFNEYFNQNLEVSRFDYLKLSDIKHYNDILSFISKPVPFCRYCAISKMDTRPWLRSKKSIDEYII